MTEIWQDMAENAKVAATITRSLSTAQKNNALVTLAIEINNQRELILEENQNDLRKAQEKQLGSALIDRLSLDNDKIDQMIAGINQVIDLPDPVGEISELKSRPSGIRVGKMRTPLGVIAIIYESRPNVTVDASILCFKSGNACILRGGSEALLSNIAIYRCVQNAFRKTGIPTYAVQLLENTDRAFVNLITQSPEEVDVVIPRGGEGLIRAVCDHSQVPVLKHLHGNCHIYVEQTADLSMAEEIAFNAKTRRYGVCNAMESLLVDAAIAGDFLPTLAQRYQEKGVELRGCERTQAIIEAKLATEDDWFCEYLDAVLSIKIVDNCDDAIAHINHYGSAHSDAIISNNFDKIQQFMRAVDSSSVMVNASTAFADGFEYGLGAEIGISTDKLHARGPIGLEGLTNQKYIVLGQGEIRA